MKNGFSCLPSLSGPTWKLIATIAGAFRGACGTIGHAIGAALAIHRIPVPTDLKFLARDEKEMDVAVARVRMLAADALEGAV